MQNTNFWQHTHLVERVNLSSERYQVADGSRRQCWLDAKFVQVIAKILPIPDEIWEQIYQAHDVETRTHDLQMNGSAPETTAPLGARGTRRSRRGKFWKANEFCACEWVAKELFSKRLWSIVQQVKKLGERCAIGYLTRCGLVSVCKRVFVCGMKVRWGLWLCTSFEVHGACSGD